MARSVWKGPFVDMNLLKKAEKEDCWIVRIVETHGRNSRGTLHFKGSINECNLIEWENIDEKENIYIFTSAFTNSPTFSRTSSNLTFF